MRSSVRGKQVFRESTIFVKDSQKLIYDFTIRKFSI